MFGKEHTSDTVYSEDPCVTVVGPGQYVSNEETTSVMKGSGAAVPMATTEATAAAPVPGRAVAVTVLNETATAAATKVEKRMLDGLDVGVWKCDESGLCLRKVKAVRRGGRRWVVEDGRKNRAK